MTDMYKELYEEAVERNLKMASLIGTLSAKLFFIENDIDAKEEVVKAREAIEAYTDSQK